MAFSTAYPHALSSIPPGPLYASRINLAATAHHTSRPRRPQLQRSRRRTGGTHVHGVRVHYAMCAEEEWCA